MKQHNKIRFYLAYSVENNYVDGKVKTTITKITTNLKKIVKIFVLKIIIDNIRLEILQSRLFEKVPCVTSSDDEKQAFLNIIKTLNYEKLDYS